MCNHCTRACALTLIHPWVTLPDGPQAPQCGPTDTPPVRGPFCMEPHYMTDCVFRSALPNMRVCLYTCGSNTFAHLVTAFRASRRPQSGDHPARSRKGCSRAAAEVKAFRASQRPSSVEAVRRGAALHGRMLGVFAPPSDVVSYASSSRQTQQCRRSTDTHHNSEILTPYQPCSNYLRGYGLHPLIKHVF